VTEELGQIAVSGGLVVAGLLWARGGLRRRDEYRFGEDLRATFLRVRWAYSGDLLDGGPRLIAPFMLVVAGLGLLVAILVRRLGG